MFVSDARLVRVGGVVGEAAYVDDLDVARWGESRVWRVRCSVRAGQFARF